MAGLTWLHLSDWHQKGKDFDRVVVRDALMEDIKDRAAISTDLEKIDFVIFSGDVAYHGKAEEYQTAIDELFNPLLEAAGVERDQLFIVPGNHDLERAALELLPDDLLHKLNAPAKVNEWLTNERKLRVLLTPMENYGQFIKNYLWDDVSGLEPAYGCVRHLDAGSKKIALIGLNSALLCGRHKEVKDSKEEVNDYGYLILGEPQLYEALGKAADADVRIAVLHHPSDWLTTTDTLAEKSLIRGRLSRACHFVLHGHEHEPNVTLSRSIIGDCVTISAGSSYDRREPTASRYANGYNFVHLDFETEQGTVYLRRYEDRQGWICDTGTTGDDTPGFCIFTLPKDFGKRGLDSITEAPIPLSYESSTQVARLTEMDRRQRHELVDALLASMTISDRNTRDVIVNDLPDDIKNTIQRNPVDRVDVTNIVTRCLDFPNGIEELIEIVRFYEGGSTGMQKIDELMASVRPTP